MKAKFYIIGSLAVSLCIQHSLFAGNKYSPFANVTSLPQSSILVQSEVAKLVSFQGSLNNNKVVLQWVVTQNETADQFEIEKSNDGKNFSVAALVFGTDKPDTDSYMFYEKSATKKIVYRIKIIDKKGKVAYSDELIIEPNK